MIRSDWLSPKVRYGARSFLVVIAGAWILAALGATVLFKVPITPRDRAAPALGEHAGSLRIVVLGTSLSSANRYRWPDEVGNEMSARIGHPVEVVRISEPGATSTWGAEQVYRLLDSDPDIVLIEFAMNDADARDCLTLELSVAQHQQIISALQGDRRKPAVFLLTMNPAYGPRAWIRPLLGRYYASYASLAERNDIGLIDLYARWLSLSQASQEMDDGVHPSDRAATRVIVAPVVDALADIVR